MSIENIAVTVIVPVYNVEKYLKECVDSLINQTLKNIELIFIDDGSKDNSLKILNEYAERDSRIKVISQKNSGPSAARNKGIEAARGEYITFVDSDDWVSLDMCEKIYQKASHTSVDVLIFSEFRVANSKIYKNDTITKTKSKIAHETFRFEEYPKELTLSISPMTVGKLYKRSFINNNNIRFNESIHTGEDRLFFFSMCFFNPTFSFLEDSLYYYRLNTVNSLSKNTNSINQLYTTYELLWEILLQSQYKNNFDIKFYILENATGCIAGYYSSYFCLYEMKRNIKLLKEFIKKYKEFPRKYIKKSDCYKWAKTQIARTRFLYIKSLLQPVIEIENRHCRFVVYLFEKQILNISKNQIIQFFMSIRYGLTLFRLRFISNFRKIRVGFWVIESQKWTCQNLYDYLKQDKRFEPFILLSHFSTARENTDVKKYYHDTREFFENKHDKVYSTFNPVKYRFKELKNFKPDIIFYQQPWQISKEQILSKNYNNVLLCYVPYCFYSMNSFVNYLSDFHGTIWKYFVETQMHSEEYKKYFNANNCVVSGSTKLDAYSSINKNSAEAYWKTKNKTRIIYAPHHSFDSGIHELATFRENGKFILELAKTHPETEWIFRPHPVFMDQVLRNNVMTKDEINQYYKEWENIGTISVGGNYYEMFSSSDLLITDCISFLSEYAPTLKPVFHLRKNYQKEKFNNLVSEIDSSYYQIYTNEELAELFERVVVNKDDFLAEKRKNNGKLLPTAQNASERIYDYIKKELWVK